MKSEENTNSTLVDTSTEKSGTEPGEIPMSVQKTFYIYREDVVIHKTNGKIGTVTEVAGDSDSDSSNSDDEDDDDDEDEDEDEKDDEANSSEEDGHTDENALENADDNNDLDGSDDNDFDHLPLKPDHIRVIWIDDSETTEHTNDVTVMDRGFLHGDYVAPASDPSSQIGIVVDANINVNLLGPDGSVISDVPSKDLNRIRDFTVGDHVVLGPWLGRIEDVFDNVTVSFDDGSVCKVMKADPLQLKPVGKKILEDGHFPYYPGQRVKAISSSVLKSARWLSGFWKANRLEGTVSKVTVGSVYLYWIASAGYGPDAAITPSEEQSPNNLKLLSCFTHTNWQLGDWCLFPSSESVSHDKGLLKRQSHNSTKEEHESTETGDESDQEASTGHESAADAKLIENSSVSGLKDSSHEAKPFRKKIRKVVVRKDNKKARKKVENFERALLIIHTKTKVDVAWQDGTIKRGLDSTSLISIETPGDHDFLAEQYVVEKAADENNDDVSVRHVGIVKSVDTKARTARVRWLKPIARAEDLREFDKEEVVSVYELEIHPDYDYCYGDVVVRLSPVSLPLIMNSLLSPVEVGTLDTLDESLNDDEKLDEEKNVETALGDETCTEFTDLSWVGNITGLKEGDIEVTWADGMVSTVGPQAIYVAGRDDDYSMAGGSDASDDAASWETVEDNNEIVHYGGEERTTYSASDIRPENEDGNVDAENSESSGALSAAIGFMTRLASGIFSRGLTLPDPLISESESEDDLSSGQLINSIENQLSNLSTDEKEERHDSIDASRVIDIADANCKINQQMSDSSRHEFISKFKGFDIISDPSDHNFLGAQGQNNAARKWLKKVQQDWDILQKNLPESICVRVYEDRMDLLRALIVGAYGTPYQDGLFFFDFHLPPEYPDVPPTAYYHSHGWRVNPNLYEDGKVCLSLLNTWSGKGNEVWDPSTSSILQVLVSLQGLVLNAKPYFNEAGYDKQVGTAEGEKNSLSYNENTFLLNCKTMMALIRKPPKDFEELVFEHFKKRGYYILKACDAYMKGGLIGSLNKEASINTDGNSDSTSVGFKLMLAKIVPKLFSALNQVGAECDEFKHLVSS